MQEYSAMWKSFLFLALLMYPLPGSAQSQSVPSPAMQSYRHPTGFVFEYPAGWKLQDVSFAEAQLVPQDQAANEKGVTEGFFLWCVGGKFKEPDDEKLIAYFDSIVTRLAPFLKRTSEASIENGRSVIEWSGKSEDDQLVYARAGILPHASFAFGIVMIGTKERLDARKSIFQEMLNSFRIEDFTRDFELIGRWGTPSAATQTQSADGMEMEIRMDGSFVFDDRTAGTETPQLSGEWYAVDGLLSFVLPESVSLRFGYELEGKPGERKLILHHASGGIQELVEMKGEK